MRTPWVIDRVFVGNKHVKDMKKKVITSTTPPSVHEVPALACMHE
jgi:hypothetical protein